MKVAYLFAGQGQQFDDMGFDIYQTEARYREVIDAASEVLKLDLMDSEVWNNPANVPIAITTMNLGIYNVLSKNLPATVDLGLSLGEYSALTAAKAMDLAVVLPLVQDRNTYMIEAGNAAPSKMVAVINATDEVINNALSVAQKNGQIQVANYNTPKQVVVGGEVKAVDQFVNLVKDAGVKRIVPLKVPIASHTPLMKSASQKLAQRLARVKVSQPNIDVISNTTNKPFELVTLKQTLTNQLAESTHFRDNLKVLENYDLDLIVEVGPGKALSGFAKKTMKDCQIMHVSDVDDLSNLRAYLNEEK